MIRIPLSISPDYVDWSWWQALRELFQNGVDAHERGQPMSYSYFEDKQQLVIKNAGAKLLRKTLVLGVSSKKGMASQRGEFGEGYKLAVATLCKLGAKTIIYNGKEVWRPELAHSEMFNTEVLFFDIKEGGTEHSLTFVISGVPKSEWDSAKSRLLFLQSPYPDSVSCSDGNILLQKHLAGKLYVGGIYVGDMPDSYAFGYDLANVVLDRDRKAPDVYSLRYVLSRLLRRAVESGKLEPSEILDVLESGGGEALSFDVDYGPATEFHKKLAAAFDAKYGSDAIPVSSLEEGLRARDFCMRGVVVNAQLLRTLRKVKSTLDKVLESRILEVSRVWSAHELDDVEVANLRWAITLVSQVEAIDLKKISIVDFVGDRLWGKFDHATGNVFIARRIIKKHALIPTIVHELCHRYGVDGDVLHRDSVEDRLGRVIDLLRCGPRQL